jgi:membrane protease YdiL (CAAX protease family)
MFGGQFISSRKKWRDPTLEPAIGGPFPCTIPVGSILESNLLRRFIRLVNERFPEATSAGRVFRARICALLVSMVCVAPRPEQWPESSRSARRRHHPDCDRLRSIGIARIFSRLVRWRVGAKWYAIIFATPVVLCLFSIAITLCFLPHAQIAPLSIEKLRELPDRFLFILFFIGLGEEPGWRGFALPQFQTKHSPLIASLILAPLWALWHLPLIGNEFPWPLVAPFVLSVFGATFMLTWIFNGTKESVLLPMLFHATVNTVGAGLVFPLFSGASLVLLWWVYGLVWLCTGLGALLFFANSDIRGATTPTVSPLDPALS